jgi:signal transduction histidine kinase
VQNLVSSVVLALLVASPPRVLTTIDDALRLTPEEAAQGIRVRLRGVVSYADPVTRDFFMGDSSGTAISMWYPDPKVTLTQGDLIEVEGKTERGDYAPKIAVPLSRLEVLAHHQPVALTLPTQAQLVANGLDCRHIETDAVVRDVNVRNDQVELRLATLLGPTRVLFATGVPLAPLKNLVGAEIRVRSTVGVDLNDAHQRVGLRLYTQSLENVRVLHPSSPLGALQHRTLEDLLTFRSLDQSDPRVIVEGEVIHARGRHLFLAEGEVIARLTLADSDDTAPPGLGARLRVVGFVEPGAPYPRLVDARILSVSPGNAARPIEVNGQGLLRGELEDRLVRVRGRISSMLLEPAEILGLETEAGPALAMSFEPGLLEAKGLRNQTLVEVVGIKGRAADQSTPVVLIRRAEDLQVLQGPPFWSLRKLLALAVLALLTAALMVLKWRGASRRAHELEQQVALRTTELRTANSALEARTLRLEAQHRALGELHHFRARFIATAAHDLRSPLTVINANGGLMAREENAEVRQKLSQEIFDAAEQINRELTNLVRSYDDAEHVLRSERFNLCEAVEGAVYSARPLFDRKEQTIVFTLPSEKIWAYGDPAIFAHVVLNLLSNASKFSPPNTRATITVSAEKPQVRVTDQGQGLDAANLARLFDRTQRPDVKPTGQEPTSGEGLLLCERWMRVMGGTITCESVLSQGSTFLLSLPDEAPIAPAAAPPPV